VKFTGQVNPASFIEWQDANARLHLDHDMLPGLFIGPDHLVEFNLYITIRVHLPAGKNLPRTMIAHRREFLCGLRDVVAAGSTRSA
jgi:hypothetical protein